MQSALGYITHATAIGIVVALPSLLVLRPVTLWRSTLIAAVAAAAGFAISLRFLPHWHPISILTNSSVWLFSGAAFALMLASAVWHAQRVRPHWEGGG